MPGTIKDPRMNSDEDRFGIAFFKGQLAVYDKVELPHTRYLPSGWSISNSSTHIDSDTSFYDWEDTIPIKRKLTSFESSNNQGSVAELVNEFLEANPRRIWRAVHKHSDLPNRDGKNDTKVQLIKDKLDEDDPPLV